MKIKYKLVWSIMFYDAWFPKVKTEDKTNKTEEVMTY